MITLLCFVSLNYANSTGTGKFSMEINRIVQFKSHYIVLLGGDGYGPDKLEVAEDYTAIQKAMENAKCYPATKRGK